jgi:ligand-binding sensor domain-containing protein
MKLNALLFLSIATAFTSCNGQNTPKVAVTTSNDHHSLIATGDQVSVLDKSIWIVFQDGNDNYWFGSDGQGVFRYDGKSITHFTTKHGLCNNRVREIKEDRSGNVFINTLDGISKFDGRTFSTLPVVESKAWKLQAGDLWFKTSQGNDGVYRYDGKTLFHLTFPKHYMEDEFYAANGKHPWSPYETYCIYKDSRNNMWFGTASFGICRFDGKTLSWMYEKHLTEAPNGGSFGIRSIIEDKEGKFWFCNTRYRYSIDPDDSISLGSHLISYRKEKGIDLLENRIGNDPVYYQYIVEDHKRDLWMSTYTAGVWKYDGKTTSHYPLSDDDGGIKIISIYKDNHGDLWLGTEENGVYKFNGKAFEKFKI